MNLLGNFLFILATANARTKVTSSGEVKNLNGVVKNLTERLEDERQYKQLDRNRLITLVLL